MDVSSLNLLRGLRLRPTDEEIIDFLWSKNSGNDGECSHIREVHFYKHEPWDLPDFSFLEDQEWFFFSPLDPKHRNGKRLNRRTEAGYWKVTGKDDTIKVGKLIRTRRILVFYRGPSKGTRTDWVAHEYRITLEDGTNPFQNTLVLYHLFDRSNKNSNRGRGQKFGKSGPGVSISTSAKPPRASISPVSEVQGEDSGGTISDGIETDQYSESGYGAYATADEVDLQLEIDPQTPLTALSNTAAVTTTPKSSPEEAVFNQARASLSPASGEEASNPAITFGGTTTPNIVVSTMFNDIGDNLFAVNNQVAGATPDEVGDLDMSDVPPESTAWSTLVSILELEVQGEIGCTSQPVTDDLNCHQVGVTSQYGANQSAANVSFSRDDVLSLDDLNENQIVDDESARKDQVTGVAAGEMVDSNMSDGVPESPCLSWFCSSALSSLSTEMQKDSGYSWNCDDLESLLWGPSQVGPNRLDITVFGDSIFDNPDEVLHNDPSSQKNIAFGGETQENIESIKDHGSTVHRMQKKPNALLDPTSKDSMWSEEIYGETSSGSLHTLSNNYVGGSSIRSLF